MNWFSKLLGREEKYLDLQKPQIPPVTSVAPAASAPAEKLSTSTEFKEPVASTAVSTSEARAMADKLGLLKHGAAAAALHLGQKPSGTIYVCGVITCVCSRSLPLTVSMTPGWSGGGPSVSCPDCGARIAIMEEISDDTAVIVASIEAVKREYQPAKISLIITGFPEKNKEVEVKLGKLKEVTTTGSASAEKDYGSGVTTAPKGGSRSEYVCSACGQSMTGSDLTYVQKRKSNADYFYSEIHKPGVPSNIIMVSDFRDTIYYCQICLDSVPNWQEKDKRCVNCQSFLSNFVGMGGVSDFYCRARGNQAISDPLKNTCDSWRLGERPFRRTD